MTAKQLFLAKDNVRVKLEQALFNAYWKVFAAAPKDTWNLCMNALKMAETTDGYVIYIDDAIAPYMPYTNEKWTSPRWGGKKNPNEGWFNKVAGEVLQMFAEELHGIIKEVSYDKSARTSEYIEQYAQQQSGINSL